MTHFLISEENPDGHKLEDILNTLRKDILFRSTKIMDDTRPEAKQVMENNVAILALLTEAMTLAEESTALLNKAFGPSNSKNKPRIGD